MKKLLKTVLLLNAFALSSLYAQQPGILLETKHKKNYINLDILDCCLEYTKNGPRKKPYSYRVSVVMYEDGETLVIEKRRFTPGEGGGSYTTIDGVYIDWDPMSDFLDIAGGDYGIVEIIGFEAHDRILIKYPRKKSVKSEEIKDKKFVLQIVTNAQGKMEVYATEK